MDDLTGRIRARRQAEADEAIRFGRRLVGCSETEAKRAVLERYPDDRELAATALLRGWATAR